MLRASLSHFCVSVAQVIVIHCYGRRCESQQRTPALSRCHRARENGVRPRSFWLPRGLSAQRPRVYCLYARACSVATAPLQHVERVHDVRFGTVAMRAAGESAYETSREGGSCCMKLHLLT